jgi:hypothetical protein
VPPSVPPSFTVTLLEDDILKRIPVILKHSPRG